jgi:hypothetical protein
LRADTPAVGDGHKGDGAAFDGAFASGEFSSAFLMACAPRTSLPCGALAPAAGGQAPGRGMSAKGCAGRCTGCGQWQRNCRVCSCGVWFMCLASSDPGCVF